MRVLFLILIFTITIKAQFVVTSGNYRHTSVSIGDTNSTFSDTTTVGDWIKNGNGSFEDADNDSVPTYSNVPVELNPNPTFSGWSYTDLTSGTVTSSSTYWISNYVAGDDFTNIGGTNVTDNIFTATGTTPTDWTNGSTLRLLVAPDGWTASGTWDEDNYVIQDDDGVRLYAEDVNIWLSLNDIFTTGRQYIIKVVISEYTSGGIKSQGNIGDVIPYTSVGTFIDTITANGSNYSIGRYAYTCDVVLSELSIKEYHENNNIELPLSSVDGQDYRATMQMKEYDGSVAPQPIITYGTKSLTYTALTDSWQTYTFDFTGNTATDTIKISLSDTAKGKIDNLVITR